MKEAQRSQQFDEDPTAVGCDGAKDILGGGIRREVTGCPTGLAECPQAQADHQPGGGGAPGTGASATPVSSCGEDVNEAHPGRSARKD